MPLILSIPRYDSINRLPLHEYRGARAILLNEGNATTDRPSGDVDGDLYTGDELLP